MKKKLIFKIEIKKSIVSVYIVNTLKKISKSYF